MKLKIKKIESHQSEGMDYSSWSTEKVIDIMTGVVAEALVFDVAEIGADFVTIAAAESQMLSLGLHSAYPQEDVITSRPNIARLQLNGESICVSRGMTYNGSESRTHFIISLID